MKLHVWGQHFCYVAWGPTQMRSVHFKVNSREAAIGVMSFHLLKWIKPVRGRCNLSLEKNKCMNDYLWVRVRAFFGFWFLYKGNRTGQSFWCIAQSFGLNQIWYSTTVLDRELNIGSQRTKAILTETVISELLCLRQFCAIQLLTSLRQSKRLATLFRSQTKV